MIAIPNTDLVVSLICLGSGEFGSSLDRDKTFAILDRYAELGGTSVDTAHDYGNWVPELEPSVSEKVIGAWMKARGVRDRMVAATKGGMGSKAVRDDRSIRHLSPPELVGEVDESLELLQVDRIDLYWLHRDDPREAVEDVVDTLNEQVVVGKIRHFGASNWKVPRMRAAQAYAERSGKRGFVADQSMWNAAVLAGPGLGHPTLGWMDDGERVARAERLGIYVSIMLFQGWSGRKRWDNGDPFRGHPYHAGNNANGLDGDPNGDGLVDLDGPGVRARDAAYVRRVVDAMNDLPNVLYEVANEGGSRDWNRFVVRTLREYQRTKPYQHPVGLTAHGDEPTQSLLESEADWISPGCLDVPSLYDDPPPPAEGKVHIVDSDHLWGVGGDHRWVWKCFCRGYHVIFMDPYVGSRWGGGDVPAPVFAPARRAMGHDALTLAHRLDLARTSPAPALSSRYFCLANPGEDYVVYLPEGGFVMVDLSAASGQLEVEWIHPVEGTVARGEPVEGGKARTTFWCPFAGDGVLHLSKP